MVGVGAGQTGGGCGIAENDRRVVMLARRGPWSLSSYRETGIDTTHLRIRVLIGSLAFRLTKNTLGHNPTR